MNTLIFLLCFVCWNFPAAYLHSTPPNFTNNWSDQWFQQKLDHFSNTTETWNQSYTLNAEYYDFNGTVFLMIEAVQEEIMESYFHRLWLEEYCKIFDAFCIRLTHRYYGASRPTIDISTENLKFLTIDQALGDIEEFIVRITSELRFFELSKWVLFGMDYTGMLAALSRVNIPNLVHAVVASSTPLLVKVDFEDYNKQIENIIQKHDPECVERIKDANQIVNALLQTQSGVEILESKFNFCDGISPNNLKDKGALFSRLAFIWSAIVQYEDLLQDLSIASSCGTMKNDAFERSIDRYAVIVNKFNTMHNIPCTSCNYIADINGARKTSWDADIAKFGYRQWFYQMCTEIGLLFSSNHENLIFHDYLPVAFYVDMCKDIFGQQFNLNTITRGVSQTNLMLANLQANGDRMIFVQGTDDPWSVLEINYVNLLNDNVAVIINGGTHCSDMFPPRPTDSTSLNEARLLIIQNLNRLLA
ncbi:Alpha/Beta hydrolase fold,Peptidase S28 [Cinara cedri]|uniref:Alpha/Beta hydrolase fold,Peptidase S28 n=1 Tax=Cinara cedri TaxID=506608 RepID=A0A5E4MDP1_9HEMI|nr:Alpha/Beta hydrolase fold,Peptidase S28 [Cinara cedri]